MAQWLEHWTFDQKVLGSNPVGVESFSAMPYFSSLRLSGRKIIYSGEPCLSKCYRPKMILPFIYEWCYLDFQASLIIHVP